MSLVTACMCCMSRVFCTAAEDDPDVWEASDVDILTQFSEAGRVRRTRCARIPDVALHVSLGPNRFVVLVPDVVRVVEPFFKFVANA